MSRNRISNRVKAVEIKARPLEYSVWLARISDPRVLDVVVSFGKRGWLPEAPASALARVEAQSPRYHAARRAAAEAAASGLAEADAMPLSVAPECAELRALVFGLGWRVFAWVPPDFLLPGARAGFLDFARQKWQAPTLSDADMVRLLDRLGVVANQAAQIKNANDEAPLVRRSLAMLEYGIAEARKRGAKAGQSTLEPMP